MTPEVRRRRSPIVFVAYGDGGFAWLRALRVRCVDDRTVRSLIEHEIVQFWCVGAQVGEVDDIRCVADAPSLQTVSGLLDRARSAMGMAAFRDLDVREVLVLERASLFEARLDARRRALRSVMEAVPGVDLLAAAGQQGFRYRWIALADATHDPTAVDDEQRAEARRAADAIGGDVLTFLVDRHDSAVAVVDEALATRCLAELAMSFVHGDLGAERVDSDQEIPAVIREPIPRHVVSFGVAVLQHAWAEIESARVHEFARQLTGAVQDRRTLDDAFGSPDALVRAVEADGVALDQNRHDRYNARQARTELAERALARTLAEGDPRWLRRVLTEVRRAAAALTRATPLASPAVAVPVVAVLQPGADGPSLLSAGTVALGVSLVAAVAALGLLWHRRDRPKDIGVIEESGPRTTRENREDARREWEELCDRLEALLSAWEEARRTPVSDARRAAAVSAWCPEPPIGRRLTDSMPIGTGNLPVTAETCRNLARDCIAVFDGSVSAAAAFEEACRLELRRRARADDGERSMAAGYVQGALAPPHTSELRDFIRRRPYLANPATPPQRDSVVWLSSPHLGLHDALGGLEQAAVLPSTVQLTHDDEERSVRLVLARPVPWDAIPSLSPPAP